MNEKPESAKEAVALQPDCCAARLEEAIKFAKHEAVDALNRLDYHEGNLRKWEIIERAIRSVLAVQHNSEVRHGGPDV